jgi:hypothetical protein
MAADYLLMRAEDLVFIGLRCAGFQLAQDNAAGGLPVLEAISDDARVMLVLPAQHIAEQVSAVGSQPETIGEFTVWRARLAGPSRAAFRLPRGQRVPLTVAGVLGVLTGAQITGAEIWAGGAETDRTAIEMPWGLLVYPVGDPAAGCYHPAGRLESPAGVVGLWQTRVRSIVAGAPTDHGLTVWPIGAAPAGGADPFPIPLTAADRQQVVARGSESGVPTGRLELSSLGGTLSARGAWEAFEWDHDATLGRDQRVRTLSKGRCFPLGHRIEYAELTQRTFDPGSPGRVATLRKQRILNVTQLVQGPVDDATMARGFPFHEVEITQCTFTDLDQPKWTAYRPTLDQAALQSRLSAAQKQADRLGDALRAAMVAAGWVEDFLSGQTFEEAWHERRWSRLPQHRPYEQAVRLLGEIYVALGEAAFWAQREPELVCFVPTRNNQPVQFPVRLRGPGGEVNLTMPLVFVADVTIPEPPAAPVFRSLSDSGVRALVENLYGAAGGGEVGLAGVPIALTPGEQRQPGDVHEVHGLTIAGVSHAGAFRPTLTSFRVALPALRSLLGAADRAPANLMFTEAYRSGGDAADVVMEMATVGEKIGIDFTGRADRSGGLVSPKLDADAISRRYGPVQQAGVVADAVGALDPSKLFAEGATLLGFRLADLIGRVSQPPTIAFELRPGQPPVVRMAWAAVPLKSHVGFEPVGDATLDLTVESTPDHVVATCTVRNFALLLPPSGGDFLRLTFGSVAFTQEAGHAPTLEVTGVSAEFLGVLKLLQALQGKVGLGGARPTVDVSSTGIAARYALPVPEASVAAFVIRNIVFRAGVDVPFTGDPVSVLLGFGSRERPFSLTVLGLGGGGYVDLLLDHRGLRRLEVSLEFGAVVAINFLITTAEVHAVGGIRYTMDTNGPVGLTGFIRIGGSVEVLGLVSISVELVVGLKYDFTRNELYGRATLVVEIDLTLYSDSVELDSGNWVIPGGDQLPLGAGPGVDRSGLLAWRAYREAFAS